MALLRQGGLVREKRYKDTYNRQKKRAEIIKKATKKAKSRYIHKKEKRERKAIYGARNKNNYHMEGQKSNKEKRGEKQHAEGLEER